MKYVLLFAISGYQLLISPLLKQLLGVKRICRFSPSCSQVAKSSTRKHGALKGIILFSKQFSRCQPFFNTL